MKKSLEIKDSSDIEAILAFHDELDNMGTCQDIEGYKIFSIIMERWREEHFGICEFCGQKMLLLSKRGSKKKFCSASCRVASWRLHTGGQREKLKKRDKKIYEERLSQGSTFRELGIKYGLSGTRVSYICHKQHRLASGFYDVGRD